MTFSIKRESNSISLATFWETYLLDKFDFNPAYQRLSVWSDEKQSFLIDSILRNFPIPPIFLHQHIDEDTGRTSYDVIDGKQRLTSIVRFIKNEIPVASDMAEDDQNPEFEAIAGKMFNDFDGAEFQKYKKAFWRYVIPIEYIDSADTNIIRGIFDRLNRNGEPLEGQELRNAKFSGSELLKVIRECSQSQFWKPLIARLDVKRMEDLEFVSELLFVLLKNQPLDGSQRALDDFYATYANSDELPAIKARFLATTELMAEFSKGNMDLVKPGISHVYGVWTFAVHMHINNKPLRSWSAKLADFYEKFFNSDLTAAPQLEAYKLSVTYRTRTKGQRVKRLNALLEYVDV